MTIQDQVMLAIAIWKENRGGGHDGMQSVANVICRRSVNEDKSIWEVCTDPEQFSPITVKGDPELTSWAKRKNTSDYLMWLLALSIAEQAANGTLLDITGGADLYYAPSSIETTKTFTLPSGTAIPFPEDWNSNVVTYTGTVQHQVFFRSR